MSEPLPVHMLKTNTRELHLEAGQKVYHLPDWHGLSHPDRLGVLRQIAMMRGRDPRIAQLALKILKDAKVKPREYKRQAAALLAWVQNPKNVYYVNEPGERLQDPVYTVKVGHGDCDDMITLLAALYESIALPWKLCLSGREKASGRKLRHIEGAVVPPDVAWVHIYGMVGDRPFRPNKWYFVEPTVQGVPLGWDVIDGDESYLPEMAKPKNNVGSTPQIVKLKPARVRQVNQFYPVNRPISPAYQMAYGDSYGEPIPQPVSSTTSSVGASVAGIAGQPGGFNWRNIGIAIVTGVVVSVGANLALDMINGRGLWEKSGPLHLRLKRTVSTAIENVSASVGSK